LKTARTIGKVAGTNLVDDTSGLMVISQFGKIIRIDTKSPPRRRPSTQGVKLLDLETRTK
jgi:DNA gyrase subunit A